MDHPLCWTIGLELCSTTASIECFNDVELKSVNVFTVVYISFKEPIRINIDIEMQTLSLLHIDNFEYLVDGLDLPSNPFE